MDYFPEEYLSHLCPLVLVQGLGKRALQTSYNPENAQLIKRVSPEIDLPVKSELIDLLKNYSINDTVFLTDAVRRNYNNTNNHNLGIKKLRFKFVNDSFKIPSFKKRENEHSDLSPRNPDSHLYPDGIISSKWIAKYRDINCSVVIGFYQLDVSSDSLNRSEYEEKDKDLTDEINDLKTQLALSGIRLMVVLICEKSTILNPEINDRVNEFKRNIGLPWRAGLFFLPSDTRSETELLIKSIINSCIPSTLDYFTALEKQIRKKKSRAPVRLSNSSLTVAPLSQAGWEVRYNFKLACIAEFKQEFDNAIKIHEVTYEYLLEVFETLSPTENTQRWKEARLLLDAIVFKIAKLYLYMEFPNISYRKFDIHIQSIIEIVKVKKISLKSYPNYSYLSKQFEWLADLVRMTPSYIIPRLEPYVLDPADYYTDLVMPHPGYIYLQALHLLRRRKASFSELSTFTSLNDTLDKYLSLPPAEEYQFDYEESMLQLLKKSRAAFTDIGGKESIFERALSFVEFQIGEAHYCREEYELAAISFERAIVIIQMDRWVWLAFLTGLRLSQCYLKIKKMDSAAFYFLELLSLNLKEEEIPNDLRSIIKQNIIEINSFLENEERSPKIELNTSESFKITLFESFLLHKTNDKQTHNIEEAIESQLVISSNCNKFSPPLNLTNVHVHFDNDCVKDVMIIHDETLPSEKLVMLDLENPRANLLFAPGEKKVLHFSQFAQKIGQSTCQQVSAKLETPIFDLEMNIPFSKANINNRYKWFKHNKNKVHFNIVKNEIPRTVLILPKHPNVSVSMRSLGAVFLDETVKVYITVESREDRPIEMALQLKITRDMNIVINSVWTDAGNESSILELKEFPSNTTRNYSAQFKVPRIKLSEININLLTTFITNEIKSDGLDDKFSLKDEIKTTVSVLEPFHPSFGLMPRITCLFEPSSPFVIDSNASKVPAIPYVSRYWELMCQLNYDGPIELELIKDNIGFKNDINASLFALIDKKVYKKSKYKNLDILRILLSNCFI